MKKIIALLLALTLCLGMFAGCDGGEQNPSTAPAEDGLALAKDYLYSMYKEDDGTQVRRDFSRVAAVMIDGVSYAVTWTVDSSEVTISAAENSKVTIDINEAPAEDVTFTLTATITAADGKTETVTFTHYIKAPEASGVTFVAAPVAGTAYKFALEQNNLGKTLYFTGAMSGYYLAMSENPFEAVDVFVEDVDGGQRIYFMDGETKTYIDIVPRGADNPGKVNVVLTAEPTCVYTWDAERKTFTTTVEENPWYLGTYSTYNTISASNTSYIQNPEVIGVDQFPAGFCTVNITATQVATPAVDTAYKFAVVQNNLGKTLYFTGSMSGYYLATSVNPAEGVNVYVENVDGGQRIYFMAGETKTYIDIVPRGADNPGKVNVVLTEEPTCVFTWDAERKTYTTTVEENTWYLGCYSSYNTISASNTSYIENPEVIGDTQYPAGMYTVDGYMDLQPEFGGDDETGGDETTSDPAADSTLSIKDAAALGASKEHNVYTTGKYYVTGVVKEIKSDVYGNMIIADESGNEILIYGSFDAKGENRFDAMAKQPAVGDTITIYGIIGQFNGTPQIKNGWITAHTPAGGSSEPEETEPEETEPEVTEPEKDDTTSGDVTLADGMKVVIYAPAHGKALSSKPSSEGSYYQMGVDVTMKDGKLSGYADTEVWTVVVNSDGTYSFSQGGKNLGMQEQYSSMSLGAVNDDWTLISLGNGLYLIKNVVRENCIEWYADKGNWSSYTTTAESGNDLFHLAFYVVG